MINKNMPIGFFDSGVGGLSVLREAIKIMPNEDYIYFGDSKNAPYGTRSVEEIRELTFKAVEILLKKDIKGLVVACNTATSAAVSTLRKMYPELPLVGVEPAVKPAVELNRSGKIIIMATPMTLAQNKLNLLMEKYKDVAEFSPMPCPGLVEFIEKGMLQGEEIESYINSKFSNYKIEDISSIVLGCTHYPFIKDVISKVVGKDIPILDGGLGTSREIQRRLKEKDLLTDRNHKGNITIMNSLDSKYILDLSNELINIG